MRKNGGEVFERHRHRQCDDRRPLSRQHKPLFNGSFEQRQIEAGFLCSAIESEMLTAVRCFLCSETVDFRSQARADKIAEMARALDEERFALGKCGRKRVVNRGAIGISAVPPSRQRLSVCKVGGAPV